MTQKSMAYDSPVYQAVLPIQLTGTNTLSPALNATITGASATSNKFTAFTNMLIKSLTLSATTVGTSTVASNAPLLYRVTNNGTTGITTITGTYTLVPTNVPPPGITAVTSNAYVINAIPGTGISSSGATALSLGLVNGGVPLLPGDICYIAKGTDATEVVAAALEAVIAPLANVTS